MRNQDKKLIEILIKCSPIIENNNQYSYIHKSIQEFYLANYYVQVYTSTLGTLENDIVKCANEEMENINQQQNELGREKLTKTVND